MSRLYKVSSAKRSRHEISAGICWPKTLQETCGGFSLTSLGLCHDDHLPSQDSPVNLQLNFGLLQMHSIASLHQSTLYQLTIVKVLSDGLHSLHTESRQEVQSVQLASMIAGRMLSCSEPDQLPNPSEFSSAFGEVTLNIVRDMDSV